MCKWSRYVFFLFVSFIYSHFLKIKNNNNINNNNNNYYNNYNNNDY